MSTKWVHDDFQNQRSRPLFNIELDHPYFNNFKLLYCLPLVGSKFQTGGPGPASVATALIYSKLLSSCSPEPKALFPWNLVYRYPPSATDPIETKFSWNLHGLEKWDFIWMVVVIWRRWSSCPKWCISLYHILRYQMVYNIHTWYLVFGMANTNRIVKKWA